MLVIEFFLVLAFVFRNTPLLPKKKEKNNNNKSTGILSTLHPKYYNKMLGFIIEEDKLEKKL